jgi:hypothetical protein
MSRKNGGIIGPANTPVGGLITGVASGVWRTNDLLNFVSNDQWPKAPQSIDNSCLFDGSGYGQRSISTAGSGTTATFSAWVKPSALPDKALFTSYIDSNNFVEIYFTSGQFRVYHYDSGGTSNDVKTTPYYKDESSWYHFHVIFDTTNGTEADRIQMYVNGNRVTALATSNYPTSSQDLELSSSSATFNLGARNGDEQWKGYMAEVVFIDGQALTPSSFGETNTATGIWTPKKIGQIASAGTNSFYLDFKDSSNLGKDQSGLGNNFTVSGLASTDQGADTCVNNFATINPNVVNKSYNDGSLAEGNTYFAPNGRAITCSTIGVTKGKWYAEFKAQDAGALYIGCGQLRGIDALSDGGLSNPIWYDNNPGYAVGYGAGGSLEDGTGSTSYGSGYSDNNIVGVALDMDNYEMYISVNGTFQNSGDPTSGSSKTGGVTGATSYNPFDDGEPIFFFVSDFSAAGVGQCYHNYGNPAFSISSGNSDANGFGNFEYAVPSGYYALNTSNLNTYG